MILALRSTMDGSSDEDDPTPDFPTQPSASPRTPPPAQGPSVFALLLLLLPPLTEPTELFESPKHTCEPVSESVFMTHLWKKKHIHVIIIYYNKQLYKVIHQAFSPHFFVNNEFTQIAIGHIAP